MADIRAVADILRLWDPIGVEPGRKGPSDEYDTYAPHIVSMVRGGCNAEDLAAHLENLSIITMGLGPGTSSSKAHSRKYAVDILARLKSPNIAFERTRRE
jgi:hypothetical protein